MPKIRGWRLHLPKKWGGETNLEKFLGMDKEDPNMGEGGGDGKIQKWGDEHLTLEFFSGWRHKGSGMGRV